MVLIIHPKSSLSPLLPPTPSCDFKKQNCLKCCIHFLRGPWASLLKPACLLQYLVEQPRGIFFQACNKMVLRVHKSSPNETFAITSTNVQSWNALGVDWLDAFACLHQFTKFSKKSKKKPVGICNESFHRLSKNICHCFTNQCNSSVIFSVVIFLSHVSAATFFYDVKKVLLELMLKSRKAFSGLKQHTTRLALDQIGK